MKTPLELLSPARNLECGMAAIDCGADAVYIGADMFGARAAAGNTIDDIQQLCSYAHHFGAKVYVTVNTIVYDKEISRAKELIKQIQEAGADAILIQDMGLYSLREQELWTIPFHASTQTDNKTIEKVRWLRDKGFRRVVLARELSAEEIRNIHEAVPDVELEVFVHGALCVSYSGQCYASQHCFHRSANRGECAQFCRLRFSLEDSDNNTLIRDKYLLSLKDLCQIDNLESLAEAGAVSFKIEGRLKDSTYVKNVVAAYSNRLDEIISKHPEKYCRASLGHAHHSFEPNLQKTFNRGFTSYFHNGRQPNQASFDTPKAIGEFVGKVKEIRGNSFNVAGLASFANGDGLCFINREGNLEGFRVNKVQGNRLFPLKMPANLMRGTSLYRNSDQEFERLLQHSYSSRKISLDILVEETTDGIALTMATDHDIKSTTFFSLERQEALKPQQENIKRQLGKLGNTQFECRSIRFSPSTFNVFIPSSQMAEMRRKALVELEEEIIEATTSHTEESHVSQTRDNISTNDDTYQVSRKPSGTQPPHYPAPYMYNIANAEASFFYAAEGIDHGISAYETCPQSQSTIMQCRYCLRHELGYCVKREGKTPPWREPLYLVSGDGKRFRLSFNCARCQMDVIAEK